MMQQVSTITVLYDGSCSVCKRSIQTLLWLDCLHRLHTVNFREEIQREQYAPDLTEKTLDRAMHIRLPNGMTFTGFDAFRELSKHLPALWIAVPFFHLPLIAPIGRRVYALIARRRKCRGRSIC